MIHFIDEKAEFERVMNGEFIDYVRSLKAAGTIRHIGLSTHNPDVEMCIRDRCCRSATSS